MTNDEIFRASSFLRPSSFVLRHSSSYQIDLLAFLQSHNCFLPSRSASNGSPHTSLLASVITCVHVHDLLLKKALNCVLDLNLVRLRADPEDILILLFAHQRRLFSQRSGVNNLVWLVHCITPLLRQFEESAFARLAFPTPCV